MMLGRVSVGRLLSASLLCGIVGTAVALPAEAGAANPWKLMVIVPLSAPSGNLPYAVEAVKASAQDINGNGGFGGRQIEVTACDTQTTASGSLACARQAISQGFDSVVAQDPFDSANRAVLDTAGIPTISGVVQTAANDKLDFPLSPPAAINPTGASLGGVLSGQCKRIVFASADISITRTQYQTMHVLVNKVRHGAVVGAVFYPAFSADYATPALQVKQMNPDCVYDNNTNTGGIAFAKALAQLGGKERILANGGNFSAFTDFPNLPNGGEGDILVSQLPIPDPNSSLPYERQYFKDMATQGLSATASDTLQPAAMAFWMYIQAMKALSKTVKGPVTTQSMIAAARKGKNINVVGALTWSPGRRGPAAFPMVSNGKMFVYQFKSGRPVPLKPFPVDVYKTTGIA